MDWWKGRVAQANANMDQLREQRATANRKRLEQQLQEATRAWTVPLLPRSYEATDAGQDLLVDEAAFLHAHNYRLSSQSSEGGHVHAGRLLLTGGFSILAGRRGIRSRGKVTVTFERGRLRCYQCPLVSTSSL